MKNLFEIVCYVESNDKSKGFYFGDLIKHVDDGSFDWVGNLYVQADSSDEAWRKFQEYLERHATSWEIKSAPVQINQIDHELHLLAILERGEMESLEKGNVIQGWGF